MVELQELPWNLPTLPERTVGWVIRAGSGEPVTPWLRPGVPYDWKDARLLGKEPGQPVLFFRRDRGRSRWTGWGHVQALAERWRSFGVRTVCARPFDPPLDVIGAPLEERNRSAPEVLWENRALAATLGILRFRDRTPYREVGARDFRLTISDLRQLTRLQPLLREHVSFR